MREIDLTRALWGGGVHVSLWSEDLVDDAVGQKRVMVVDDVTLTMTKVEAVAVARKILAFFGEVQ